MEYKLIPCNSDRITPIVTHFFTFSTDKLKTEDRFMVPSGRQYILFYLSGKIRHKAGNAQFICEGNASFIHLHDFCFSSYLPEKSFVLGVSLRPNAIYKLYGKEFQKSNFFISDSRDFLGDNELQDLYFLLKEQQHIEQQITALEKYFESGMDAVTFGDVVDRFLDHMHDHEFEMSTREIARHLFTNQRTLEMKFFASTGLTPGKYIKLKRFINLFKDFSTQRYSVIDLIHKYNYIDYSHLSRDFKKYTGASLAETKIPEDSMYKAYITATNLHSK